MEYDIVFTDKVNQAGFGIFPPGFPSVRQQLFCVADVADRGIKPYIQHLSFCSFYGYRNTPIKVTAYCTGLQTHVKPAFTLTVYIGTPFFMIFQNPLAQPAFMLVKRQIPMLRFAHYGLTSADGAFRINQVCGAEARTALFALVTVGTFCMAVGTFACDIAVGKESLGFLVVILHTCFFDKIAFIVQLTEEFRSGVVMSF